MRRENRTPDEVIAAIASRSHGVITRLEMLGAGLSGADIDRRARRGALIRVHRGVYRVGHSAPSIDADYLAAVRACGPSGLLFGRAAAFFLSLVKLAAAPRPQVAVTTERRVPGIRTRRDRRGAERDAATYRAIPITSVARTLVDLAGRSTINEFARACHEAGVIHRTTPAQVKAVLARRPSTPGAAKVRAVMLGEVNVTLSRLEAAFLKVLRDAGLPLPITNRPAGGYRVDCRWPDHRLTVELDSYQFHNSRYAWEQDRRRERQARARGDEFRRYTWYDVVEDRRAMVAELLHLLSRECPA
jgi:very-short-patch-repair endonuclease/predicted transcriptional regulator of viral defense system